MFRQLVIYTRSGDLDSLRESLIENKFNNAHRMQVLMFNAILKNQVDIVKFLIEYGVDPYNKGKRNPLDMAIDHNLTDMEEFFRNYNN